jgi:hypothetical protein
MKRLLPLILLACVAGSAFGMGGAPIFIVGQGLTRITAEGTHAVIEQISPSSTVAKDKFSSDRVMCIARYGMMPNVDISGQLGIAGLNFKDLSVGYADYVANWSLAWGADARVGYPAKAQPYQVVAAIKYFGFRPHGTTGNGQKSFESTYLWHEISPALTAGYVTGPLVPYVGIMKQYLFGQKDVNVTFNGQQFAAAGGKSTYSDGKQAIRTLLGLEWRSSPDGYTVTAEASAGSNGIWTVSVGLSQVLK